MGFVGIPELRQLQELIGACHDELPMVGFLQNIHRVIHCLAQQQKQLRGNALRNSHQLLVHLLDGDSGEMPVQKLHQSGHLVPVHLQLHPQQLALHPVVAHHHDHDADEVFTSWGHETAHKYSHDELESILTTLDSGEYGAVLRAKGIVDGGDTWYEFDMVPGEHEIRTCGPDVTGKVCVIGSQLKEHEVEELFHA